MAALAQFSMERFPFWLIVGSSRLRIVSSSSDCLNAEMHRQVGVISRQVAQAGAR